MATLIHDATELQAMSADLTADYELANNIDASATVGWNGGLGFVPIGTYGAGFTGSLNGANYTISNLCINRPAADNIGLFGAIDTGGIVYNLSLDSVSIVGDDYVGALVGWLDNNSETFSNIQVIEGIVQGDNSVGGFIGEIDGGIPIFDSCSSSAVTSSTSADGLGGFIGYDWSSGAIYNSCNATGTVTGAGSSYYVGGFVGWVRESYSTFNKSYATGDVSAYRSVGGFVGESNIDLSDDEINYNQCYATGNVSGDKYIGGFGGRLEGTCKDCYARGSATGTGTDYVGGFAGWSDVLEDCYSTGLITGVGSYIGGLIGRNFGTVTTCYWDTQTSGTVVSGGGTGKTTAEMKTRSTFSAWDFSSIWSITSFCNNGYPCLQDVTPNCALIPSIQGEQVREIIALEAIRNIEMSCMGRLYVDEEGNLTYESRYARNP